MPSRGTVCAVRAPVRRWTLLVLILALVTASCGGGGGEPPPPDPLIIFFVMPVPAEYLLHHL